MNEDQLTERVHALEVAQATQAATQAGAAATTAASQAGTVGVMIAGSAGLVAGLLLGILLARAPRS
jgi:predicted lipid-binding transport protein (Tim44 family)